MGRSRKQPLKSEDGMRAVAEELHARFNRDLQCPTCLSRSSKSGAFNLDSGGKPNSGGEGCRRFKCRSWPKCSKTMSVVDFIALCHGIHPTTVDQMLEQIDECPSGRYLFTTAPSGSILFPSFPLYLYFNTVGEKISLFSLTNYIHP
jgi:hypothetical protein